jgi:hypothetical protein
MPFHRRRVLAYLSFVLLAATTNAYSTLFSLSHGLLPDNKEKPASDRSSSWWEAGSDDLSREKEEDYLRTIGCWGRRPITTRMRRDPDKATGFSSMKRWWQPRRRLRTFQS